MNLTDLEFAALRAVDLSEYGYDLTDAVWTFTIADNIPVKVENRQISGIVSSLVQKGWMNSGGWGNEAVVEITDEGAKVYLAACAAQDIKPSKNHNEVAA